jgi:hypothetical protein
MAQVSAWLESPQVVLLSEEVGYLDVLSRLIERGKISGPRVHDGQIAALCIQHGVRELLSADRDFSRFGELKTRNPLVTPPRGSPQLLRNCSAAGIYTFFLHMDSRLRADPHFRRCPTRSFVVSDVPVSKSENDPSGFRCVVNRLARSGVFRRGISNFTASAHPTCRAFPPFESVMRHHQKTLQLFDEWWVFRLLVSSHPVH